MKHKIVGKKGTLIFYGATEEPSGETSLAFGLWLQGVSEG